MHMTPSTPRTSNFDMNKGESNAQRKPTVIRFRIPLRLSNCHTPTTPIPTATEVEDMTVQYIVQLSVAEQKSHDDLEAEQNNVDEDEFVNFILNSKNDPDTRLDPGSYKESPEVEITVVVQPVNVIEEEYESEEDDYELRRRVKRKHVEESRNTPSPIPIRPPRIHSTLISSDNEKLQELTVIDPKPSYSTPSLSLPKPASSIKPSYSLQPKIGY
ncbi:hypothetical protein Tco_1398581, partial [Tanacetum coccineum]